MRFDLSKSEIINVLALILVGFCERSSCDIPRPRGVSLSRASLYNPEKNFTCFDNSLTIPFDHVNDDYCDCPDASDEPGTSACANGLFHCTNSGYKPLNIASSRVNDGVCDCCDASDEYSAVTDCVNNCKDLGRSAREEAQKKAELLKAGKELRIELSEQGVRLKHQMTDKLAELQKSKEEAENVKTEKEAIKQEIEALENSALEKYKEIEEQQKALQREVEAENLRKEAVECFNKFDSNQNGLLEISELQTRSTFDRDRNGEVSEEEAKYFLMEHEAINLEQFIADAWARVKPFLMMDAGMFKPPQEEHEQNKVEESQKEVEELKEEINEDDQEPENEDDEEYPEEEQEEKPILATPTYDEETQKLIDQANAAREEFNQAEKNVQNIATEINQVTDYLNKDFGVDEEFATLQGQCFDYTDYEYVYKLCPFDKVTQQQKSTSSETRLGAWSNWVGPEGDKYSAMLYEKGQTCWNGPQRSAHVTVSCGTENKVLSVAEPNRCEYHLDFITPAVCRESSEEYADTHDEL